MRVVMIIAPRDYRAEELDEPRRALELAGHAVTIASLERGACSALPHGTTDATIALSELDPNRYDGVVFIGGPGARLLFENRDAHRVAQALNRQHRLVAAICIAPSILARAGLLKGKRVTSYPSETFALSAAGAIISAEDVVTDGNLVTASGPMHAKRFGSRLVTALEQQAHHHTLAPITPLGVRPLRSH